jgi:hypothetical protein
MQQILFNQTDIAQSYLSYNNCNHDICIELFNPKFTVSTLAWFLTQARSICISISG